MKIAHLITTIDRGGAEMQLLELIRKQLSHDHEVNVFYIKGKDYLEEEFTKLGIKPFRLVDGNFIKKIINFRRIVSASKFEIINAHLPHAELIASVSLIGLNKYIFIVTRHFGGQFAPNLPAVISSILSKLMIWKSNGVIVISRYVGEITKKNNEIFKKDLWKLNVVPYGISKREISPRIKPIQKILIGEPIIIGTLARLSKEKSLETLIYACKELSTKKIDFKCHIYGEGVLEAELKELTRDLDLSEYIFFEGMTTEPMKCISRLDIFISTSIFEGFGLAILEAMSMGLPIVGARNSAISELLQNERYGLMFTTKSYKELANQIEKLQMNKKLYESYSVKSLHRASMYSSENNYQKTQKIYDSLLSVRD